MVKKWLNISSNSGFFVNAPFLLNRIFRIIVSTPSYTLIFSKCTLFRRKLCANLSDSGELCVGAWRLYWIPSHWDIGKLVQMLSEDILYCFNDIFTCICFTVITRWGAKDVILMQSALQFLFMLRFAYSFFLLKRNWASCGNKEVLCRICKNNISDGKDLLFCCTAISWGSACSATVTRIAHIQL